MKVKQLKAIKRVLKRGAKKQNVLGGYYKNEVNNVCYFTDSYIAFRLNVNDLPFRREFTYPSLIDYFFPDSSINIMENYTLTMEGFKESYKNTPKENGLKCIDIELRDYDITFDLCKLKDVIDILDIKDYITLEVYGEEKPIIIRNNDDIALIMPIKKY